MPKRDRPGRGRRPPSRERPPSAKRPSQTPPPSAEPDGPREPQPAVDHDWLHRLHEQADEQLIAYAARLVDLEEAWAVWCRAGDLPADQEPPPLSQELLVSLDGQRFIEWLIHDFDTGRGTALQRYLADRRGPSPLVRRDLEAWAGERQAVWQVVDLWPTGGRLRDVFAGREADVEDADLPRIAVPRSIVVCRLRPCGGRRELPPAAVEMPPVVLAHLRPWLAHRLLRLRLDDPDAGWDELFRRDLLLLEGYLRLFGGEDAGQALPPPLLPDLPVPLDLSFDPREGPSLPEPRLTPLQRRAVQDSPRLLDAFFETYFTKRWVFEFVPELDSLRPRELLETARGRRRLGEYLEWLEYAQAWAARQGHYRFPAARVGELLGLDAQVEEPRIHPAWEGEVLERPDDGELTRVTRALEELLGALDDGREADVLTHLRPGGRAAILVQLFGPFPLAVLAGIHLSAEQLHLRASGGHEGQMLLELRLEPEAPVPFRPVSTLVWERYRGAWRLEHLLPVPLVDEDYEPDPTIIDIWRGEGLSKHIRWEGLDEVERLVVRRLGGGVGHLYDAVHALRAWRDFRRRQSDPPGEAAGWAAGLECLVRRLGGYEALQAVLAEAYGVSPGTVGRRLRDLARRLGVRRFDRRYALHRQPIEQELRLRVPLAGLNALGGFLNPPLLSARRWP